jgi:hypothetical protein
MPRSLPKDVIAAVPVLEPGNDKKPGVDDAHQQVTYLRPGAEDGPRLDDPPSPATPKPVQPATPRHDLPKRQFVNQSKVMLDYEVENVGQSGVGKVEVWLTRNEGKTWQKHCEDIHRKTGIEVPFPEDGLYGVTLVVTNGRGVGNTPPVAGDRPEWMIEVDTTKPSAQITNLETLHEKGAIAVLIAWSVKDKNLAETPVDLFYGATSQGPWLPIAKGLKSEGEHRWTPPTGMGAQAFLRLTVSDLAGNSAAAGTLEPIQLEDAARPRGVIRGIRTAPTTDAN